MRPFTLFTAALMFFASVAVPSARAGEPSLAPYFEIRGPAEGAEPLPLKSTHADVRIAGVIAQVRISQTYANEGKVPIEAVYVFPASTRAAVSGLRMTIGERVLTAEIDTRERARTTYDAAKSDGKSAALLEQDRPNVFRMSVANILPGDRIAVDLDYTELLAPDGGKYQFVIPAVVGPRYASKADATSGLPYVRKTGAHVTSWSLDVRLAAGMPIHMVQSPTHVITPHFADGKNVVELFLDGVESGNRDFVLDYWLAGGAIQTGLLLSPPATKGEDGHFLLMVQPPERVLAEDVSGREYVFVVDVSGSMGGFPLETAKILMRDLLGSLRPTDDFNVLLFSGGSAVLSERSLPATADNIAKGIALVDGSRGGGGTEILPALTRAMALPPASESRTFVVVTDGFVAIEAEAFDLIRKNLHHANLFAFGIGSSVNRFLIEGLARAGMGEPFVVLDPAEAAGKAADFRAYVSSPVLTSVNVRFDGVAVSEVEPGTVPDLFASRPVIVFGKYAPGSGGQITVSGRTARRQWTKVIPFGEGVVTTKGSALRQLWARHRIASLEDDLATGGGGNTALEIQRLGLAHSLLTSRTSFVAVDEVVRNGTRESRTVRQPLPLPPDVSEQAIGYGQLNGILGAHGSGGLGLRGSSKGGSMKAPSSGAHEGEFSRKNTAHGGSVQQGGEDVVILGSLDPAIIDAVIKRHLAQIQYCYDREVANRPSLAGKVVAVFTIDASGRVASAKIKSTTLKDPNVEACLTDRMMKVRFPQPKGGGVVTVTYPFLFRKAED